MIYLYYSITVWMEIVPHILYSGKEFGTRKDSVPCTVIRFL
jgi:hypothetical protein